MWPSLVPPPPAHPLSILSLMLLSMLCPHVYLSQPRHASCTDFSVKHSRGLWALLIDWAGPRALEYRLHYLPLDPSLLTEHKHTCLLIQTQCVNQWCNESKSNKQAVPWIHLAEEERERKTEWACWLQPAVGSTACFIDNTHRGPRPTRTF